MIEQTHQYKPNRLTAIQVTGLDMKLPDWAKPFFDDGTIRVSNGVIYDSRSGNSIGIGGWIMLSPSGEIALCVDQYFQNWFEPITGV